MLNCKITWTCVGFGVFGLHTTGEMKRAMDALMNSKETGCDLIHLKPTDVGKVVSLLSVELCAQDVHVEVQIDSGHLMRHNGCGALFTPEEWAKMPVINQQCPALVNGKLVDIPMRNCTCGSTIGYSSIELMHAEEVCTGRGGDA